MGVKAARGGAVAGINADERVRVGLLDGVPAFLGDVDGMGRARIQNDAPAVLVRNLRVVGTGYQGKLVPAPYLEGSLLKKRWERLG